MSESLKHHVCFNEGTEPPFSGKFLDHKEVGIYTCTICKSHLFKSSTKFNSGTGWPSFYDAIHENIETKTDKKLGMVRIEVHCKSCKSHLGHVFPDGPLPTKQRYCINSISLSFEKKEDVSS